MAGQNDFLIFDENSTNMLTPDNYASDTDRTNGFREGLARSIVTNKVLHQTSMMAHAIGELVKDNDDTASDMQSVSDLKVALKNALAGADVDLSNLSQTGLQKFVQRTGDTMSGALKFTSTGSETILLQNIGTGSYSDIRFSQQNNKRVGCIRGNNVSATSRNIQITAADDSDTPSAAIEIGHRNEAGYIFTSTPTTINARTNIGAKLTVTSGGIDVNSGEINSKVGMDFLMNDVSKGTIPTNSHYSAFRFNDTDSSHTTWQSKRVGIVECQVLNTGENKMIMTAYKNEANAALGATLTLGVTTSGSAYCTFPNTTCVDGQWVSSQRLLTSDISETTITADLSSYLPNDGRKYVVKMWYNFYDYGDNNGVVCPETDIFLTRNATSKTYYFSAGNKYARHNCFEINLPVGTGRWVKTYFGDANTTRYWWAIGYRRIGTNS